MGVLSGVLGGALNEAGPPVVIYLTLKHWPKDDVKATLQVYCTRTLTLTLTQTLTLTLTLTPTLTLTLTLTLALTPTLTLTPAPAPTLTLALTRGRPPVSAPSR